MTGTFVHSRKIDSGRNAGLILLGTIAFLGICLNQSMRIGGINLSVADPVLIFVAFGLSIKNQLIIPRYSFIFFIFVIVTTTTTSLWITPFLFNVLSPKIEIFADLIKLVISFLFFVVGYSIASLDLTEVVLKWYALCATAVAGLGIFYNVSGVTAMRDIFFYGTLRYRGLMADPNYFAVLCVAALAYFLFSNSLSRLVRISCSSILIVGVLLSGSKTGFVGLSAILIIALLIHVISRKSFSAYFLFALVVTFLAILPSLFTNAIVSFLERLNNQIPVVSRLITLLSSGLTDAASDNGSARDLVWSTAGGIINQAPITGTGIGNYREAAYSLFENTSVAHNTYLQLAAEWGIPLSVLFIGWIFVLLIRIFIRLLKREIPTQSFTAPAMVLAFMIGSVSLSLNNARMFWLFLGISALVVIKNKQTKQVESSVTSLSKF